MLRSLIVIVLACGAAADASAQAPYAAHERSAIEATSRYEILQSPLVARSTLRLDRFGGFVDVLVMRADSSYTWDPVPRRRHKVADTAFPARANYQVFLSGIANRFTFLTNVNTGATWMLTQREDGSLYWDPVL